MNFATLDLNLLRVLDALFREGSTVRAGARLGISQSAVSNALNRLRHALNDDLLIRHGNRLVPTAYAETIRHDLAEQLDGLAQLLQAPATFDPATAEGNFKIAASDFFAEMLMPALADLLHGKAPGIRAQLVDLVPQNYIESLDRSSADLVLIPDAPLPKFVSRQDLFRSPFVAIARQDNPHIEGLNQGDVFPLDLFCRLPHVLFSPEGNTKAMGDAALAKVGRTRTVAITVPVFSGVCRAVSESDLIALIPRQLVERLGDHYGLSWFEPPMPIDPPLIIGAWHRRDERTPQHRWLRNAVFSILAKLDPDLARAQRDGMKMS